MVNVKNYAELEFDERSVREVLRYARAEDSEQIRELIFECEREIRDKISYSICYVECEVKESDGVVDLGFTECRSADLAKDLRGCTRAVVFVATIGMGIDRLISRYSRISPSRAVILHALGAERVEKLCDVFCDELAKKEKKEGYTLRPRFSPGYGDLSICTQSDIFRVLDCPRKIGVALGENLLMTPSKSVSAIIGIIK